MLAARKEGIRLTKTGRVRQPAVAVYRPSYGDGKSWREHLKPEMVMKPNIRKSMRRRSQVP